MKLKKLFWLAFVFAILAISQNQASAQAPGRWVQCVDPASGYLVTCFIPDQAPAYSTQPVYADQVSYGNQPVYQTQQRKTVRTEYDVGLSPYSRRPYGSYTRITETTRITVETNAPSYQPNIRVDSYGSSYYWPRYRNW